MPSPPCAISVATGNRVAAPRDVLAGGHGQGVGEWLRSRGRQHLGVKQQKCAESKGGHLRERCIALGMKQLANNVKEGERWPQIFFCTSPALHQSMPAGDLLLPAASFLALPCTLPIASKILTHAFLLRVLCGTALTAARTRPALALHLQLQVQRGASARAPRARVPQCPFGAQSHAPYRREVC